MKALSAFALAGLVLASASAHAVVQTAGFLEIDDPSDTATIDIQFFHISSQEDVEFSFTIRAAGDPLMNETLAAHLWSVDAMGNLSTLLDSGMTTAGVFDFDLDQFGGDQLAVGDYAFVVGTQDLGVAEFPPFQMDPATPGGLTPSLVEYEISTTTGQNALQYTCILAGNLDGSVTQSVFVGGTECNVPVVSASEPGALAMTAAGGMALAGLVAWRRRTK